MNNPCEKIQEKIIDHVLGLLNQQEINDLYAHISQCVRCKRYAETLQNQKHSLEQFAQTLSSRMQSRQDRAVSALNAASEKTKLLSIWTIAAQSRMTKFAAAAVLLIAILLSALLVMNKPTSLPKQITGQPQETIAKIEDEQDLAPVKIADEQSPGQKLAREITQIKQFFAAGDVAGLIDMLETGQWHAKIAAANYLAQIGDISVIPHLLKLSARYEGEIKDNPFVKAVEQIISRQKAEVGHDVASRLEKGHKDPSIDKEKMVRTGPVRGFGRSIKVFDGKKVIVRLYTNCAKEPAVHKKAAIYVKNGAVDFNSIKDEVKGLTDSAIVIFGEDQNDPNIIDAFGDSIYAELYKKDLQFHIPHSGFSRQKELNVVFHEAFLSRPIPEANVEMFLYVREDLRILIGNYDLDKGGSLEVPSRIRGPNQYDFILSHPNYGIAKITGFEVYKEAEKISLPLVRKGAEAQQRTIRGIIVDSQGKPVAKAVIACNEVRTLGEDLIRSSSYGTESISDSNGAFIFYLPNEDYGKRLIPPKSRYHVRIEAPREYNLLPFVGKIFNDEETEVVMESGGHFHRFAFEDKNGPITDPQRLKMIEIIIKRDGKSDLTFKYDHWKNGEMFPSGTYEAHYWDAGKEAAFEPLEVTEDSPEELVFKFPDNIIYYGQVVHGITGEPMEGVFVIGIKGRGRNNFSSITDQQWEALYALPADPCVEDSALEPLQSIYGVKKVVRTDGNGKFEMNVDLREALYGFVAFEKNYLGIMHRTFALEPDANRYAEVPVIQLYPAAKVMVEPRITTKHLSVLPGWLIEESNNPPTWVKELLNTDDRRERLFTYDNWIKINTRQSFYIPAEVNLRVKLSTPHDEKFDAITTNEVINLAQGEVYDLGAQIFDSNSTIKVSVKVVNSAGEAVKGVPVRQLSGWPGWSVTNNTDAKGMVYFHVPLYSKGKFGVNYYQEGRAGLYESIDYEVNGEEDAGAEFVLILSDDMLYNLFK